MEVTSEQLFIEVEVELGFSPTLRWIITLAYTKPVNQCAQKKITIFVFLRHIYENCKQLGSWQLFRVNSVTISASLVKSRRRMMFKNKTLTWKTPKTNFVAFFLLIGMAFSSISETDLSFAQTFRKPGRHVVTSVCSHAGQEYPRIFLDREPIRACEKHYSLVWYILMIDIYRTA